MSCRRVDSAIGTVIVRANGEREVEVDSNAVVVTSPLAWPEPSSRGGW